MYVLHFYGRKFLCLLSPKMISYALFDEFLTTKSLLSGFSTTATMFSLEIAKLISVTENMVCFYFFCILEAQDIQ